MHRFLLLLIFIVSIFAACSQNDSTEPEVSIAHDWAPVITLEKVAYQRFLISISPPEPDLESEILSYIIRLTGINGTDFEFIDDVDGSFGPVFRYFPEDAILAEGGEYEISVSIRYIDDVQKVSNTLTIQVPETSGEVLERISIPSRWNAASLRGFVIWDGAVYRPNGVDFLKLDISTKDVSFFPGAFTIDPYDPLPVRFVGGRSGKILTALQSSYNPITYRFGETDLSTGISRELFSLAADINDSSFEPIAYNGSQLLTLVRKQGLESTELQFRLYNTESGILESTFPSFVNAELESFAYYELVGASIWRISRNSFDYRLQRINPQNGQTLEEFHIPVFTPEYLHYNDGFWVARSVSFDAYSTEAIKFEPGEL